MANPNAPRGGGRSWKWKLFLTLLLAAALIFVGWMTVVGFNAQFRSDEVNEQLREEGRQTVLACLRAELATCRDEELKDLTLESLQEQFAAGEAAGRAQAQGEATTAYHQGRAEARAEVVNLITEVLAGYKPDETLDEEGLVGLRAALDARDLRQQLEALKAATPPPPTPTPTATVPPPSPTPRP